eukprot:1143188-Pelagomonas_calceolata.AAC.4
MRMRVTSSTQRALLERAFSVFGQPGPRSFPLIMRSQCPYSYATSSPHENIHGLLEGALGEGTVAVAVDAMASDGHQVAACSHDITQDGKVPAVRKEQSISIEMVPWKPWRE